MCFSASTAKFKTLNRFTADILFYDVQLINHIVERPSGIHRLGFIYHSLSTSTTWMSACRKCTYIIVVPEGPVNFPFAWSYITPHDSNTNNWTRIYHDFSHDRSWIPPWIKSITNELDVTWSRHNCLVIVTSSTIYCDVIRRTQTQRVRHGVDVWRSSFSSSFLSSLYRVRNKIIYVLSWWTVSSPTRVLFWCLFPSLLRNSGNKHQNNPFVSTEANSHSSTYIGIYIQHLRNPGMHWLVIPTTVLWDTI